MWDFLCNFAQNKSIEHLNMELQVIYDEILALKKRVVKYLHNNCTIYYTGRVKINKTSSYNSLGLLELFVSSSHVSYEPHAGQNDYEFDGYFIIERVIEGEKYLIETSFTNESNIFILPQTFLKEYTGRKRIDSMIKDYTSLPRYRIPFIDDELLLDYCADNGISYVNGEHAKLYFVAEYGVSIYKKTDVHNLYIGISHINPKKMHDNFYIKGKYIFAYGAYIQSEIQRELMFMDIEQKKRAICKYAHILEPIILRMP